MRLDRSLAIKNQAVASIASIYATAEMISATSAAISDQMNTRIWRWLREAKTPEWVRQYCQGYEHAYRDGLYNSGKLVFGGWIDGEFYSTSRDRPDYYAKKGVSAVEYADDGRVTGRGHYWAHSQKPYFIMGEI